MLLNYDLNKPTKRSMATLTIELLVRAVKAESIPRNFQRDSQITNQSTRLFKFTKILYLSKEKKKEP